MLEPSNALSFLQPKLIANGQCNIAATFFCYTLPVFKLIQLPNDYFSSSSFFNLAFSFPNHFGVDIFALAFVYISAYSIADIAHPHHFARRLQ